ncbi:MAG: nucleotidyltransferase domain-containing protein [Lachnospiraceae bacterium]|nr:nucleotidyltransferase domain-containing protein [Lachnospiraceae bacterium]
MPSNIEQLLHLYRKRLDPVLKGHMKRMILYGSYARGDFKQDSDIDVMILLDLDGSALHSCEKKICDVTYDFNSEYGIDIMPVVQNISHFNYWKKAYMFYHNVDTEGIEI